MPTNAANCCLLPTALVPAPVQLINKGYVEGGDEVIQGPIGELGDRQVVAVLLELHTPVVVEPDVPLHAMLHVRVWAQLCLNTKQYIKGLTLRRPPSDA